MLAEDDGSQSDDPDWEENLWSLIDPKGDVLPLVQAVLGPLTLLCICLFVCCTMFRGEQYMKNTYEKIQKDEDSGEITREKADEERAVLDDHTRSGAITTGAKQHKMQTDQVRMTHRMMEYNAGVRGELGIIKQYLGISDKKQGRTHETVQKEYDDYVKRVGVSLDAAYKHGNMRRAALKILTTTQEVVLSHVTEEASSQASGIIGDVDAGDDAHGVATTVVADVDEEQQEVLEQQEMQEEVDTVFVDDAASVVGTFKRSRKHSKFRRTGTSLDLLALQRVGRRENAEVFEKLIKLDLEQENLTKELYSSLVEFRKSRPDSMHKKWVSDNKENIDKYNKLHTSIKIEHDNIKDMNLQHLLEHPMDEIPEFISDKASIDSEMEAMKNTTIPIFDRMGTTVTDFVSKGGREGGVCISWDEKGKLRCEVQEYDDGTGTYIPIDTIPDYQRLATVDSGPASPPESPLTIGNRGVVGAAGTAPLPPSLPMMGPPVVDVVVDVGEDNSGNDLETINLSDDDLERVVSARTDLGHLVSNSSSMAAVPDFGGIAAVGEVEDPATAGNKHRSTAIIAFIMRLTKLRPSSRVQHLTEDQGGSSGVGSGVRATNKLGV